MENSDKLSESSKSNDTYIECRKCHGMIGNSSDLTKCEICKSIICKNCYENEIINICEELYYSCANNSDFEANPICDECVSADDELTDVCTIHMWLVCNYHKNIRKKYNCDICYSNRNYAFRFGGITSDSEDNN